MLTVRAVCPERKGAGWRGLEPMERGCPVLGLRGDPPIPHALTAPVLCAGGSTLCHNAVPQALSADHPALRLVAPTASTLPVEISLLRHPKVGPGESNQVSRFVVRDHERRQSQGTLLLVRLWSHPSLNGAVIVSGPESKGWKPPSSYAHNPVRALAPPRRRDAEAGEGGGRLHEVCD